MEVVGHGQGETPGEAGQGHEGLLVPPGPQKEWFVGGKTSLRNKGTVVLQPGASFRG